MELGDFLKDSLSFFFMYILSAIAGAFSFFLFLRVCFTTKLPLILFERTPSEAFYTSGLEKSFARLYFGLAILLFLIIGFVLLLLGKKIFPTLFASSALTIGVSYLFYRTKMSRNIIFPVLIEHKNPVSARTLKERTLRDDDAFGGLSELKIDVVCLPASDKIIFFSKVLPLF